MNKRIGTAKGNFGFPAKPELFKPLADRSNKRVWPNDGRHGYCFIKGEKYDILSEGKFEELFDEGHGDKVSGAKENAVAKEKVLSTQS